MTYGTRLFKNGSRRSYLHFSSGKTVVFKGNDYREFSDKIAKIEYAGYLRGTMTEPAGKKKMKKFERIGL